MKIIDIKLIEEKPSICKPCGGECCKWAAGIYHPDQVFVGEGSKLDQLRSFFEAGNSTTWIETDHGVISVVLPRSTFDEGDVFRSDVIGTCVNLTDTGCKLTHEQRPLECKMLVANRPMTCYHPPGFDRIRDVVLPWKPYQALIHALRDEFWENVEIAQRAKSKKVA